MDKLSSNSSSSDNVSSEFEVVPNTSINSNESESSSEVISSICEKINKIEEGIFTIQDFQKNDPYITFKVCENGDKSDLEEVVSEVLTSNVILACGDQTTESPNAIQKLPNTEEASTPVAPKDTCNSDTEKTPTNPTLIEMPTKVEDCIIFSKVFYFGCAPINFPRNEGETIKCIRLLRSQQQCLHKKQILPSVYLNKEDNQNHEVEIILSLPRNFSGNVRLLDPMNSSVIASFDLCKILYCVRGDDSSADKDCFAFNEAAVPQTFQCHVFRCEISEAVRKVMSCFENIFRCTPHESWPSEKQNVPSGNVAQFNSDNLATDSFQMSSSDLATNQLSPQLQDVDRSVYRFDVSLEIKEDDGKGGFATVPWDKTSSCFKFRCNLEKQVIVTVQQITNAQLTIERCFGLLLTPGRNVKQSDMHLLEMERDATHEEVTAEATYSVMGLWDPSQTHFSLLNTETQKGTRVFLSVAIDLVVQEIRDPIRLLIETKARIFPQNETFWYFGRKILHENFYIRIKDIDDKTNTRQLFDVDSIESESLRMKRLQTSLLPQQELSLSSSCPQDEEDDDDTDEPLLSGSGEVNRDCSDRVLSDWAIVLDRWRADLSRRPTGIRALVRSGSGVPDPLRGEVWQLLAGCSDNSELLENYRVLLTQDSSQENIIQRDVHRTFPAHDYFKNVGGLGQNSLFRISKAYSVYDREVGYCQGLSFLAAALLLHMPEEQAFCVLIKVMHDYKMRNLFKNGFEDLHLKFYELERLTEDVLPNLQDHFRQLNIECHMFSSQWFLTLFTAKFPLNMVFHVIDIFLCEGELVVFKVALGLLECCRQELLALDFEGVLKYFRVQLPKKYRSDDQVKLLVQATINAKVSRKRLNRYEKDYALMKEKMAFEVDPLVRTERKNKQLMESNMRLELENDEIAQELATTRITLNTQLDRTMKHANSLHHDLQGAIGELRSTRGRVEELTGENNQLHEETKQVKEMCRREMVRQEEDINGKEKIITDYKTICSQLSKRIERVQTSHKEEIDSIKKAHTVNGDASSNGVDQHAREENERLVKQVRDLELELAQTKLKLVESECKVQDLEHHLVATTKELQASKNTWFQKTLSTFTARKTDPSILHGPPVALPPDLNQPPSHVTTTVTSYGRL